MAVLVYDSLVPDIVFAVPRVPQTGEDVPAASVSVVAAGGGGNVAVALAAWGFDVMAAGNSVGDDPLGRWVAADFEDRGIRLPADFVGRDGITAANGIIVTPDGERTIIGSDYSSVTWLPVPDWHGIEIVMVDGYSGEAGSATIRQAAGRNLPIVGTDRTGPDTADLTLLLWSAGEHPDPAEAMSTAGGGPTVIVTDGPRAVVVYQPDGSTVELSPTPRPAADSTGAGDLFAAAVTAGLADGLATVASLERAIDVAGRYVAAGRGSEVPHLTRLLP